MQNTIADLAHVGKGAIYRHFGNKRELFLVVARFGIEQVVQFSRERVFDEFPWVPDPIAMLRARKSATRVDVD